MVKGAKPVLAVDIDDVLIPFAPSFIERYNQKHDTNYTHDDYSSYFFVKDIYGVETEDEAERYITEYLQWAMANNTPLKSEAVEAIRKLEDHYDIYVITSRHPENYEATKNWLQKQLPDVFKDVHFIRAREEKTSKAQICAEIGANVLIDDHPDHLKDCAKYGVKGLLFGDYRWNRDIALPANVQRVQDWAEALEVLL